jgi:hypothetical protein
MRFHVRRVRKPQGRPGYSGAHVARVGGARGVNHNLCGAEMTAYDVPERDAKRMFAKGQDALLCLDCLRAAGLEVR